MSTEFKCRFCKGVRQHDGRQCMGCGAPVKNATDHNKGPQSNPHRCPKCNSHNYREWDGSYLCNDCHSQFEPDDEPDNRLGHVEKAVKVAKSQRRFRR